MQELQHGGGAEVTRTVNLPGQEPRDHPREIVAPSLGPRSEKPNGPGGISGAGGPSSLRSLRPERPTTAYHTPCTDAYPSCSPPLRFSSGRQRYIGNPVGVAHGGAGRARSARPTRRPRSTPRGRPWRPVALVELLLTRSADPVEVDAEPQAGPKA